MLSASHCAEIYTDDTEAVVGKTTGAFNKSRPLQQSLGPSLHAHEMKKKKRPGSLQNVSDCLVKCIKILLNPASEHMAVRVCMTKWGSPTCACSTPRGYQSSQGNALRGSGARLSWTQLSTEMSGPQVSEVPPEATSQQGEGSLYSLHWHRRG